MMLSAPFIGKHTLLRHDGSQFCSSQKSIVPLGSSSNKLGASLVINHPCRKGLTVAIFRRDSSIRKFSEASATASYDRTSSIRLEPAGAGDSRTKVPSVGFGGVLAAGALQLPVGETITQTFARLLVSLEALVLVLSCMTRSHTCHRPLID